MMRAPDAAELLDLWERGLTQSLPRRAIALLRAAWPETTDADLLALPLGLRDARLLALRRHLFGPDLTIVAPCPACGDTVESTFQVDEVLLPEVVGDGRVTRVLEREGYVITFRLPACGDLLTLSDAPRAEAARPREQLLALCVIDLRRADGAPVEMSSVPESVSEAIAADMAAADPQADVQLACVCPSCGKTWDTLFDIASVLWSEIHAWARRLLRDVHALARAYGWREADVLALSPTRRQIYLELSRP
jgi:uncharacterized protein (UPF0212 family)